MNFDPYELLNIEHNASDADIKSAYRKLSKKYHPDIAGDSDENREMFHNLSRAKEVLSSPQLRDAYNKGGWMLVERLEQHMKMMEQRVEQCEPIIVNETVTIEQLYNREKITVIVDVPVEDDKGTITYKKFETEIEISGEGRIIAQGQGAQKPDHMTGDIVIQIQLSDDSPFTVKGNNLVYVAKLSLVQLLDQYEIYIPHPSGNLKIHGQYEFEDNDDQNILIFQGMGLKGNRGQGDLIVHVTASLDDIRKLKPEITELIKEQFRIEPTLKDAKDITTMAKRPSDMRQRGLPPGFSIQGGTVQDGECSIQ